MMLEFVLVALAQLAPAQNLRVLEPTPCVTNCTVEMNKPITIAIDAIPGFACASCAYQLHIRKNDELVQAWSAASSAITDGVVRFPASPTHGALTLPTGTYVLTINALDHTPGQPAQDSWSAPFTLTVTPFSTPSPPPPSPPPPVIVPIGPPVTLAWDASPEPDVTGYLLEYGTVSGVYGVSVPVGKVTTTTVTVPNATTTYYFVLRLMNAAGAGPRSNEVVFTPAPPCTANPSEPAGSTAVTIQIHRFDATARRSDPFGMELVYDVSSDHAVTLLEIDLEGDGEPALRFPFEDGRYNRRLGPKFTVNGVWLLTVKAWNSRGEMGSITCRPGVTVVL